MKKCGYVAIIGKPNAGKSTLMNCFLDVELSIVNKKVQTTRNKILGILTEKNYQIVFIDTPGIFEPKYELQRFMFSELKTSFNEADIVLNIVDASDFNIDFQKDFEKRFEKELKKKKRIIAINKIDLQPQEKVKEIIYLLENTFSFKSIYPVSALLKLNTGDLKRVISENLPESDFYYDEEVITDKPEKFFVAEIIREKILELYQDEIPYSVFVEIREYTERVGSKNFISAEIIVERESQKIILIGKRGEMIKKIGQLARKDIEKLIGKEVYLTLFAKVKKDWRKDKRFLKEKFV